MRTSDIFRHLTVRAELLLVNAGTAREAENLNRLRRALDLYDDRFGERWWCVDSKKLSLYLACKMIVNGGTSDVAKAHLRAVLDIQNMTTAVETQLPKPHHAMMD